jgi:hypothetical protein
MEVKREFFINGVPFSSLEEYVAVRKVQKGYSLQEHLDYEQNYRERLAEEQRQYLTPAEKIKEAWETVEPITLEKANLLYKDDNNKIELIQKLLNKKSGWDPSTKKSITYEL